MFFIFIVVYFAHATWRFQHRLRGDPTPPPHHRKPICSFSLFRDIARSREDGFVSGNGTWKRNMRGVPEYFQPDVCRFRHKTRIPRRDMFQCIKRHRMNYVVFAGDSNSLKYFAAFQALLIDDGAHCLPLQVSIYMNPFLLRRQHLQWTVRYPKASKGVVMNDASPGLQIYLLVSCDLDIWPDVLTSKLIASCGVLASRITCASRVRKFDKRWTRPKMNLTAWRRHIISAYQMFAV